MKQMIFFFSALVFAISVMAQQISETLFTFTEAGVQPSIKFIDAFDAGDYNDVTPFVRFKTSQVTSRNQLYNYQISMSKYKGWENEPRIANVIEINSGSKKLLTIHNYNS